MLGGVVFKAKGIVKNSSVKQRLSLLSPDVIKSFFSVKITINGFNNNIFIYPSPRTAFSDFTTAMYRLRTILNLHPKLNPKLKSYNQL